MTNDEQSHSVLQPLLTLHNEGYLELKRDGFWRPLCADLETNYAEVVMDHCDEVVGSR